MTEDELRAEVSQKLAEIEKPKEATEEIKPEVSEAKSEADIVLDEAVKMGYDPNYNGANKKTPEQFVRDGSFFRKIEAQNKKIDDLLTVVKGLDDHAQKLQKSAVERERIGYEKAVRELQIKRSEAVEEGDVNKFHKVEADLQDLHKSKSADVQSTQFQPSDDMKAWAKENESWFNNKPENKRLIREADGLFTLEKEDSPNLSDKEILEQVKAKIQILHPDKFENPNKSKPSAVTTTKSHGTSSSPSGIEARLSERQLNLYKSAKAAGVKMTIQDYVKQLEINGDLRND